MARISQQNQKSTANKTSTSITAKVRRTRKTIPRDSPPQRSSVFRGVTRHRWTGRYEAHLWDKNCWNESQNKKGRQVYLGAYDDEEAAARAYDLAALKYWGEETILNFPLSRYQSELKQMEGQSREEYIGSLRRKSSGFSRGVSKYRGVARHHHNGRWEARIGRVFGNKYLYLGTYATQEEAATAYDMAAIEYRGLNAVTNFDLSRYIKWLRPNSNSPNPLHEHKSHCLNEEFGSCNLAHYPSSISGQTQPALLKAAGEGRATPASSALGLLLQSAKYKEMLERTSSSSSECPWTPPPESDPPRCSFPEDVQTYFECQDSSSCHRDGDDGLFGDLSSFSSQMFQYELDG